MATYETPFKLTYGCKAMIHVEVGQHSEQHELYNKGANDVQWKEKLDMLLKIQE